MNKPTILKTERVDDIPLLVAQLERMGVQELIDQHFPTHGNWQGLSLGQVAIVSDGSLIFREGSQIAMKGGYKYRSESSITVKSCVGED